MNKSMRIVPKPALNLTAGQARDIRARAWKFIFDTYRTKAPEQGNGEMKQKNLNTEKGGPHELVQEIYAAQKV